MSASFATQTQTHNRGFLRSNGVEVSVFAMMAGLGVAMFLALTILGGDAPTTSTEEPSVQSRRDDSTRSHEPAPAIGGVDSDASGR